MEIVDKQRFVASLIAAATVVKPKQVGGIMDHSETKAETLNTFLSPSVHLFESLDASFC